ncbi:helicase HerA-like domain-containing protein, partial [Bosea massiliensis]
PDIVLAQLGNRVQHALRAYSPRDQKLVRASAKAFRPKSGLDVESAITSLAVGEALVSFLDSAGVPQPVERVRVNRPQTSMAPISDIEREAIMLADPWRHRYTADEATSRQAFAQRWRAERGLPALPEASEPYQPGDYVKFLPDLSGEPARAGRSWLGILGNTILAVGCFWVAAKLLI